MKRILIITPFRNEEQSVPLYIEGIKALSYSREFVDFYWIENDSSDRTYELLCEELEKGVANFNSIMLDRAIIIGKVRKKPPGEYFKDIPYGADRIQPWLTLWNRYIQPAIEKYEHTDYVMTLFADCVPPPDVIEKYLKVFEEKKETGWVGGILFRRYPKHQGLMSPYPDYTDPPGKIIECPLTGHCWMMPYKNTVGFELKDKPDVFFSLADYLKKQGLKVYCTPEVYLRHVSTDGKIYDNMWFPENE